MDTELDIISYERRLNRGELICNARTLLSESPAFQVRMSKEIYYSDKYEDDQYEYRHVMLPKVDLALVP